MRQGKIGAINYVLLTLCEIQIYIGMQQKQLNRLKVVLNEQGRTSIWLSKQLGKDPSNNIEIDLNHIDKIKKESYLNSEFTPYGTLSNAESVLPYLHRTALRLWSNTQG